MEPTKKTTILFAPNVHARLTELAAQRGTSMGALVREACITQYGLVDHDTMVGAVTSLAALSLPVGTPSDMKRESVVDPADLLPSR